ncbi:hypothetical protein KIN20_026118 [Parelaphostrongylus tenuis]|uniref:Uncharacterized protein n=1 Tax=Parelaphostrongylus tenuis TaxID=148309 RepID=A0AAD5NCD6_PARTN|nr:hypothetical protein KIN20_026118 [Parelaphostrongylus tenuis]
MLLQRCLESAFRFKSLFFSGALISATDPDRLLWSSECHSTIDTFLTKSDAGSNNLVFTLGKICLLIFRCLLLGSLLRCGNALRG